MQLINVVLVTLSMAMLGLVQSAKSQGLPTADPEMSGFSVERLVRIDNLVRREIVAGRIPGALTVIARDGKIVYENAAGYRDIADRSPLTQNTIFRIYSMTKPVIGVATMILVEEGRLKLSDPVAKYIPGIDSLRVYVSGEGDDMVTEPLLRPLLVRHLVTHTAGFSFPYGDTGLHNMLRKSYKRPHELPSLEEFVEQQLSFPLRFQPGERWEYGTSFDTLAYVIEVAATQPLQEFLAERIFRPLKMIDTGFYVPEEKVGRFASTYNFTEEGLVLNERGSDSQMLNVEITPRGGGGLVSTESDYLRFAQMLLNNGELDGVRILSPTTVRTMTSNHLPSSMESFPGEGYGVGFGVDLSVSRKGVVGNDGSFHWSGADRTHFWVDPKTGIIGLFLTQVRPFSFEYDHYMRNLTYQALVE